MEAAGGDRWKGGAGKRRRLVVVVIEYMCKVPECPQCPVTMSAGAEVYYT